MKDKIKEAVWQLIEQHYNVDRGCPNILTAKNPYGSNQIDQIGEEIAEMVNQILQSIVIPEELKEEEEAIEFPEPEFILDLDDESRDDGDGTDAEYEDDDLIPWMGMD